VRDNHDGHFVGDLGDRLLDAPRRGGVSAEHGSSISKTSGATASDRAIHSRGSVTLRRINGSAPTVKNAKTGQITLRVTFVPTFLRLVYHVLAKTSSGTFDPKYLRIFGTSRASQSPG